MISERFFVGHYNGAWNLLLPMGDALVRRINVDIDRFSHEIGGVSDPQIRGLVNELGFELAMAAHQINANRVSGVDQVTFQQCSERAIARISRIERRPTEEVFALEAGELSEAKEIGDAILEFLDYLPLDGAIRFAPRYRGCGFIDSCNGDLVHGRTLCEFKAGDRSFRLQDLRQLLTYAALNKLAPVSEVTHLALVNPRRGIVYTESCDVVARLSSGRSFSDLADSIIDVMCGAGASR